MKGILVFGFIIFVVLMPFFALREFGMVVGEDKLYELLYAAHANSQRADHGNIVSLVRVTSLLLCGDDSQKVGFVR